MRSTSPDRSDRTGLALPLLERGLPSAPGPSRRPPDRPEYRSVWISDVHLGSKSSKAEELLGFLDHVRPEFLYLVGDIIDEWRLRRAHYWPDSHEAVVSRIRGLAGHGSRVTYVPGNHDRSLRAHHGTSLVELACLDEVVHETADGRRVLVVHGDRFDDYADEDSFLARTGDWAYHAMLRLNDAYNRVGRVLGMQYRSISLALKQRVKEAVNYVGRFEERLLNEARSRRVDGVVCGHVHEADLRETGGVLYGNDGDWVGSCTALVEHLDGHLELVQWRDGAIHPIGNADAHRPPASGSIERPAVAC